MTSSYIKKKKNSGGKINHGLVPLLVPHMV